NMFQAKQQRLLVEPLRTSWKGPEGDGNFLVDANVGIYARSKGKPIVPDVFLSLEVVAGDDYSRKENRSYFAWVYGKMPEVVIEIVSNKVGREDMDKFKQFARMGIPYYAIFDPFQNLGPDVLRLHALNGRTYHRIAGPWLPIVSLGLTLWRGPFEGQE